MWKALSVYLCHYCSSLHLGAWMGQLNISLWRNEDETIHRRLPIDADEVLIGESIWKLEQVSFTRQHIITGIAIQRDNFLRLSGDMSYLSWWCSFYFAKPALKHFRVDQESGDGRPFGFLLSSLPFENGGNEFFVVILL